MDDSRSEVGKVQDEPGTYFHFLQQGSYQRQWGS